MGLPTLRTPAPEHLPAVQASLRTAGLPVDDLGAGHLADFLIAVDEAGQVTHCAGVEPLGSAGLLRSVAVSAAHRNLGEGSDLLVAIERRARQTGVKVLYLLTTEARGFFERHGYARCDRAQVPQTTEFATVCPASAVCLSKSIETSSP